MNNAVKLALRAAALLVVAVGFCAGCNEPPAVRDVLLPTDTTNPLGPYEVRAVVHSDDALAHVAVRRVGMSDRELVEDVDAAASAEHHLRGAIPGAPVGTVVEFAVVACDEHDACVVDPPTFPTDAYRFVVGAVPAVPAVSALSPAAGPASGGTVVDVRGAGFQVGVRVSFDDVPAARVERLRGDALRVVTPPHVPGDAAVVVTNPDGGAVRVADAFAFRPSPALSTVTPASGPERGGTALTLSGSFVAGDTVRVGGVPCRDVLVAGEVITCRTPPGIGVVDVDVVRGDGGIATAAGAFSYIPAPRVDGVQPDFGNADAATEVIVIGSGFGAAGGGSVVDVGGSACVIVSQTDTQIDCVVPPGPPGIADVRVDNSDGQSGVLPGGYSRRGPPVLVVVDPGSGPLQGGIPARILGAGLDETDIVTFGDALVEVTGAVADVELDVIVPRAALPETPAPAAGFVDVDVTVTRTRVDDNRSDVLVAGFRYLWPPEVTAVTPPSGPIAGGTDVVVTGRFFTPTTTLSFDNVPCASLTFVSSTQMLCTTPPGDAGLADVGAVDRAGFADDAVVDGTVAVGAFTYVPPPRIDSITPPEGPSFGGDVVTVRGDFFVAGALVFIDGAPCSGVVVVDAQTLTCTTPPGERGPADVMVLNVDQQFDVAVGLYEYVGVAVSPDHGLPVGFTRVSVRGAGFAPGVVVTFDNTAADCTFVSSRELTCQTPGRRNGNTGVVEVRFRNPDGTGDADDAFTYTALRARQNAIDVDGRNANHVVLGDADNDGDADLFVAFGRVNEADDASVFLSRGGFAYSEARLPGGPLIGNKIDLGSINSDRIPDIIIASSSAVPTVLLRSTGPASWTPVELSLTRDNSAFDAQLADLVGDDRDDVFVLGIGCDPQTVDPGEVCDPTTAGRDALFEQTGQGGASVLTRRDVLVPHEARQAHDHKFVVTDLDGDDDNDVVVIVNNSSFPSAQNRILRNRTSEGLGFVKEAPVALTSLTGDLYDITAGDIDGDGDNDVLTSLCFNEGASSSEVVLRNENGALVVDDVALPAERDDCSIGVAAVDIDSDGDLDLMWSGATRPQGNIRLLLRLYVNRGDGSFVDASDFVPDFQRRAQGNSLACDDLDGDGDVDCVLAVGSPYVEQDQPGDLIVLEQRAARN